MRFIECEYFDADHHLRDLFFSLQWRHNGRDGVSNHQLRDCLLNRLFRRRSKKTSKLRITGLCAGNSPVTGEFPHKWPVTRKMFTSDDVIMCWIWWTIYHTDTYTSSMPAPNNPYPLSKLMKINWPGMLSITGLEGVNISNKQHCRPQSSTGTFFQTVSCFDTI